MLPYFKGEHGLFVHVENNLVELDNALASYLTHEASTTPESVHNDVDLVDSALERVVAFDAAQGQRLGLEMQRIRSETRGVVVLLLKGVKVFTATMHADRDVLGEKMTEWMAAHPRCTVIEIVQTQSSDQQFHCVALSVLSRRPRVARRAAPFAVSY